MIYKLFIFTCSGGCSTGVAATKASIRLWEENPDEVKVGCLPAVAIPAKLKEITKNSEKRMLVDACAVKCGVNLIEREGLSIDRYLELTSELKIKKAKELPSKELEEQVYQIMLKEVNTLLGHP